MAFSIAMSSCGVNSGMSGRTSAACCAVSAPHAEKVDLPLHVRAVALGDAVHHLFVDSDELRALRARRIERACADQVLDRTLIDLHAVHAAAEILKVDERAVELTLLLMQQNEPAADVLDGDEAEADALGARP